MKYQVLVWLPPAFRAQYLELIGRWGRVLNNIALATLIGAAIYFGFFEPPYLAYRNVPFPVATAKVRPGDTVTYTVIRCNSDSRTRIYATSRTLVGDSSVILPATQASINPGCHESLSSITVVPPNTKPGTYRAEGYAEIAGTVRTHLIRWQTEPFEVVP